MIVLKKRLSGCRSKCVINVLTLPNYILTLDGQFGGALCPPQGVLCDDGVVSGVFGAHSQDEHGAHATGVGDVVVGVCIEADVISVPGDMGGWIPSYSTAHVALVALGSGVHLQRNQELRRPLQVA